MHKQGRAKASKAFIPTQPSPEAFACGPTCGGHRFDHKPMHLVYMHLCLWQTGLLLRQLTSPARTFLTTNLFIPSFTCVCRGPGHSGS